MKMEHRVNRCGYCNNISSNLKWCGRCRSIQYCTRLCQSSDWSSHKTNCNKNVSEGRRQVTEGNLKSGRTGTSETGCDGEDVDDLIEKEMNRNSRFEEEEVYEDIPQKIEREYNSENNGNGSTSKKTNAENETDDVTASSDVGEDLQDDSKSKENVRRLLEEKVEDDNNKPKWNICEYCTTKGCLAKCSRCKGVYYCSKECQVQDWKTHKVNCKKIKDDMEERDARRSTIERLFRNFFQSDHNLGDPIYPALPPEQAEIRATPPKGSLLRAIKMTKKLFPNHKIVTNFVYVPSEPTYNFFPFVQPSVDRSVLVAFMYKYHENVIRHAVCLKDDCENKSKVEFYIDCDHPLPYFSFSQVKPGGYICIVNAAKHLFRDGSVGMRIDKPENIKILDIETVMK